MLLLESYARNYWKLQTRYLSDKPATRKLVELLVQRNDKFSRRLLIEMMQLREEETAKNNIDNLVKEYNEVSEKMLSLIKRLYDKGAKFIVKSNLQTDSKIKGIINSDKILTFVARDIESTTIIKQLEEYVDVKDNLQEEIEKNGGKIDHKSIGLVDPETKKKLAAFAITKNELMSGHKDAKSALGRILMFFGANFKLLWEKLTTKYKLAFWGSIILGLLIVALVTIYKNGKENTVAKVIKNVLITAIAGFALYNLIVLIMSLKDQFSDQFLIFK